MSDFQNKDNDPIKKRLLAAAVVSATALMPSLASAESMFEFRGGGSGPVQSQQAGCGASCGAGARRLQQEEGSCGEGSCGGEGASGEGSCGEGSCGGDTGGMAKASHKAKGERVCGGCGEGSCGGAAGEGSCGEGSCGDKGASGEGSCGEGSCGS